MSGESDTGTPQVSNVGVVEIGSGDTPHPDSDYRIDIRDLPEVDQVMDITETPWPIEDNAAAGCIAHHVLEHVDDRWTIIDEICRVVRPGGMVSIKYPVGELYRWSDDHTAPEPGWRTFDVYDSESGMDVDENPDFPLRLVDRRITSLWFWPRPLNKASPVLRLLGRVAPEVALSLPGVSAEITGEFEVIDR